ncbi:hypothetical protein MHEC_07010 [Mycobacterium heckeshornense]|uniref:Uncharacterized protein n=1 Tax=Mycobacterium heckeshornense TaxID=110505 RepID=A0A7R7GQN5_9MYCO|nr:hypothetical protein MHEC_07010 [Mycobacterium heckeshornense]
MRSGTVVRDSSAVPSWPGPYCSRAPLGDETKHRVGQRLVDGFGFLVRDQDRSIARAADEGDLFRINRGFGAGGGGGGIDDRQHRHTGFHEATLPGHFGAEMQPSAAVDQTGDQHVGSKAAGQQRGNSRQRCRDETSWGTK